LTHLQDLGAVRPIAGRLGAGVWLEYYDCHRYLDAISSWWTNLFGHANERISGAVAAQAARLEHVLLAGFTHEPAIVLAEQLTALAGTALTRCFFADSGSAAVEVALKMSFHYWRNCGLGGKRRFLALSNSYHGETLGALSVGDVALYRDVYQPLLLPVITVPSPDCYLREAGVSWEEHSRRAMAAMEAALERHAGELAAVIVEPLVQCAGGMRMYHPVYLQLLREASRSPPVHLIADEIAVGFDAPVVSSPATRPASRPTSWPSRDSGRLPAALGRAQRRSGVAAFLREYAAQRAFLHSHSYTGNPLACAAAPRSPRSRSSPPSRCSSATPCWPRAWPRVPRRLASTLTWRKCANAA
jgi:adenosylmethionine-8-amino-7-oxononanoate aminotransferase